MKDPLDNQTVDWVEGRSIPTFTQIRQALKLLAEQKSRPDYEIFTIKEVKVALENGLNHPLIEDIRPLIAVEPEVDKVVRPKKISQKREVKHRVYAADEEMKEIVEWLKNYKGRIVDIARLAGCSHSTLFHIKSGRRSFTIEIFNKLEKARKELEVAA
ncbi:MAG TPA: XRE family transcriptional regulator [Acinetobacter venetianus]|uniref:helix-turn-helix domain-containing protein n=1 Tax=Acinetobacter venetianus TaxID=52133 RepID=UPI001A141182|nr:helix-turn-helix transcriptional regulator [Acinetobacter venetianus]HIQ35494.1 XRE family transcriptional regulator [Acinetobacter venetianus]